MSTVPIVTLSDDVVTRAAVRNDLRSLHMPSEPLMEDFHAWMTTTALNDAALFRAAYPEVPRIELEP